MKRTPRSARGFTLIELMIVVAIIGILASIATPEFLRARLRARGAERPIVADAIAKAVMDHYAKVGTAILDAPANPPDPVPGPEGRLMVWTDPTSDWQEIFQRVSIDRKVYYQYSFQAVEQVGETPATLLIHAEGDLDGDGVRSTKTWTYQRMSGAYVLVDEAPAAGQEDAGTF